MTKLLLTMLASAALTLPAMAQQKPSQAPPDNQQQQSQQGQQRDQTQSGAQEREIVPSQLSRDQVEEIQQALNKKGFHSGNVDGVWGPATVEAVKNFQQKQGMTADGKLNEKTLSALGLDSAKYTAEQPDTKTAPGAPPSQKDDSPRENQPGGQKNRQ